MLLSRVSPTRLAPAAPASLAKLGALVAHVVPAGAEETDAVQDTGGMYLSFMDTVRAACVLVRPDFYAFGGARDTEALPDLVQGLVDRLGATVALTH